MSLLFLRNSINHLIPINENIKVETKDTIKGIVPIVLQRSLFKSEKAKTEDPSITGMANKKEYLTAVSRSKPNQRDVIKVEPEREIPGITASVCPNPTRIE